MKIPSTVLLFLLFLALPGFAQTEQGKQIIRGTTLDKILQTPLQGAIITIPGTQPLIGTRSNEQGNFQLPALSPGRYTVKITYVGYKEILMENVQLSSGKETVLKVEMEEALTISREAKVKAHRDNTKALNDLATVSATTLRPEEINRYAGSRQDPSRMAANFAGVVGGNDQRNDILVRGNSPMGVLWRFEGVDIHNPNHFSVSGNTGGVFSIINNNNLSSSDFFTGAFPAEYGSRSAAVFDVRMRNGNNQKREHTFQVGLNGLEAGTEGPIPGTRNGSYLISARTLDYSFMNRLGINLGVNGVPRYSDLNVKFLLPTRKAGIYSLWFIGGMSNIDLKESDIDTAKWPGVHQYDNRFGGSMFAGGINHQIMLGSKTLSKFSLAYSRGGFINNTERYDKQKNHLLVEDDRIFDAHALAQWTLTHKFNARHQLKGGITYKQLFFDQYLRSYNESDSSYKTYLDIAGTAGLAQAYLQWHYQVSPRLEINLGVHGMYLFLNNTWAVEPRLSARYQINEKHRINAGAGMHSQVHPLVYYLFEFPRANGQMEAINKNLDMMRSAHAVLGYQWNINKKWQLKSETYYQYLWDVPVSPDPANAPYSFVNLGADFSFETEDSTVNTGLGRNYGIEFTLERNLDKGFYFLGTLSIFRSDYQTADHQWRQTAFSSNFVANVLVGKEFKLDAKGKHVLSADAKFNYAGNKRYVAIDQELSRQEGHPVWEVQNPYARRLKDYSRIDLKVNLAINRPRSTHNIFVAADNLLNTQNEFYKYWDSRSNTVQTAYQFGMFPYAGYRLNF